jgi:RNA polymerase sigma factor (sigma-70 family)
MHMSKVVRDKQDMELSAQIENLFRRDRSKLVGFIRERVRSREEAEDILQDVFANVLAAASEVTEPIENLGAWVFTAIRNRIIDSYRKKRPQTFTDTIYSDDEGDIAQFENFLSDVSLSPERSLVSRTIRDAIMQALDELPREQKYAFVKNEFEGVSFREMAEETGENINTLLARKRYAVLYLRKRLKELYETLHD